MAPVLTFASSTIASSASSSNSNTTSSQKHYLGSVVNTGKDNGFSENNEIGIKDPHYGWNLGRFFVNGFTQLSEENNSPVFIKNVGDRVTLWFNLEQNINSLNGDSNLTINEDINGYDEHFGISKTNFGRGMLITRFTNYENKIGNHVPYKDYLLAIEKGADTKVELCEEGDYEISLDYEIKNSPRKIAGKDILPSYTNYKVFFKFSVRNGNCMVFPFDIKTKAELINTVITENGFYLDLAKSRYLDVIIKKEVMKDGADGLTEDVRFNKPAKDGDQFAEPGIYTISVSNKYTRTETTKKIYVGTNNILKANLTTGLSIGEIKNKIALGATIADNGMITMPLTTSAEEIQEKSSEVSSMEEATNSTVLAPVSMLLLLVIGASIFIIVILVLAIVLALRKSNSKNAKSKFDKDSEG
jgi:hypothetical protein